MTEPKLFNKAQCPNLLQLSDKDFSADGKIINREIKGCNGYIMFYAPWCPHCQNKEDFIIYLGEQFNAKNSPHYKEKFRIAVVDTTQATTAKITQKLGISGIPRFFRVNAKGELSDYQGDYTIEAFLTDCCQNNNGMCNFNPSKLKPPSIK
jgi:thiol-disulfide isomerase/thioredoxin